MKALAIVRSSVADSIEDQQIKINAFALSEMIEVTHTDFRDNDNFSNIKESLKRVDAVIVTDITRITRNKDSLDLFTKNLNDLGVRLITLT